MAALHYLASGELLTQAEGEARYGAGFDWTDCYLPETHPRAFGEAWRQHRAAIEAHARTLKMTEPWVARAARHGGLTMQNFMRRWRAWRSGLAFVLVTGRRTRIELTAAVVVDVDPDDREAIDELRAWLPGWHVTPYGERRARLTPPAIVTEGES